MKKYQICIFVFLVAASLCFVATQSQAKPAESMAMSMDDKLIADTKAAWEAYKNKDEKGLGALMTDDCVDMDADGSVNDRAALMQRMMDTNLTDYSLTDFHVMWIDKDAAIVHYTATFKGAYKGQAMEGTAIASDVWVKTGGKWLDKHHQETMVPPPPKM